MPTERDFTYPVVADGDARVTFRPTNGVFVFARVGKSSSHERPAAYFDHGRAPEWEVEWLARKLTMDAMRRAMRQPSD